MNSVAGGSAVDQQVETLKSGRRSPAVAKARLIILRSERPGCVVFAYEGDDDKSAYAQWVRRIREDLAYEPFPCDGKTQVFELQDLLEKDLSGLATGVFFFVDRDFDDLRGRAPSESVFMTDKYSVENYLVSDTVLEELLKDEFHCHAAPGVRSKVLDLFKAQRDRFVAVANEANFKIFLARQLKIKTLDQLPRRMRSIADVKLADVNAADPRLECQIKLQTDPSPQDRDRLKAEFDRLHPPDRHRGKFLFAFFLAWLKALAIDRNDESSQIFAGLTPKAVNVSAFSVGLFASKADMPPDLRAFIEAVAA